MSRPNPENRPKFFNPLQRTENTITDLINQTRATRQQVTHANSKDLKDLQDTLQDLQATLIEAKQLIKQARAQEKHARNR